MKIEIEFTSTYEADIVIDGRKIKFGLQDGAWKIYEGIADDEFDTTIGGIVACRLISPLIDILQGHIPDFESPDDDCWETWEKLSEEVADEVYERVSGY